MQKILLLLLLVFSSVYAVPVTYKLDPNHSYVQWTINHFGFSNPSGKWFSNGTLMLDQDKIEDSNVNVTINVGDIHTGLPELDDHLKSPLFFDATKFPTATYISDKVVKTGDKTFDVTGNLTVHGVTQPVTLHVTINKIGMNLITNLETAGFSAATDIERSAFGIKTLLPGLSDNVPLTIQVEASTAS